MHAVAIRLQNEGFDDHVIAVAVAVDDDQVPVLLQIACAKLDHLMALPVDAESAASPGRSRQPASSSDRPNTSSDRGVPGLEVPPRAEQTVVGVAGPKKKGTDP